MKHKQLQLTGEIAKSFSHSYSIICEFHYATERLTRDVKRLETQLEREIEETSPVIERQVRDLIAAAREFLALCRKDSKAEYVPYCLAAVDYLVNSEDAVPDFQDYDGFSDDIAVFAAVVREFGLQVKLRAA